MVGPQAVKQAHSVFAASTAAGLFSLTCFGHLGALLLLRCCCHPVHYSVGLHGRGVCRNLSRHPRICNTLYGISSQPCLADHCQRLHFEWRGFRTLQCTCLTNLCKSPKIRHVILGSLSLCFTCTPVPELVCRACPVSGHARTVLPFETSEASWWTSTSVLDVIPFMPTLHATACSPNMQTHNLQTRL